MASIRKEIYIDAAPEHVWAVLKDVGAVHRRLAPGFVTEVRLDGNDRIVTFGNGFAVRERIVDIDDPARRLAYSASGGRSTHHNASMQVFAAGGGGSRLVWITDLLPDDAAPAVAAMMEQGCDAMRRALNRRHDSDPQD